MYKYLVFSYLARGIYIEQVRNWLKSFPREQVLIQRSEDLFHNPQDVYARVLTFLGLPDWKLDNYEIFNYGRYALMDPKTEKRLREYFNPYNQELYEYLGFDFGWKTQLKA
jgi:N-formylglutamate amidohydrolase